MVSAGCEGEKEPGSFGGEASRWPCLRLLIYEPEKEISHLSLFIFFSLSIISFSFFFSLFLNEIKLSPQSLVPHPMTKEGK